MHKSYEVLPKYMFGACHHVTIYTVTFVLRVALQENNCETHRLCTTRRLLRTPSRVSPLLCAALAQARAVQRGRQRLPPERRSPQRRSVLAQSSQRAPAAGGPSSRRAVIGREVPGLLLSRAWKSRHQCKSAHACFRPPLSKGRRTCATAATKHEPKPGLKNRPASTSKAPSQKN